MVLLSFRRNDSPKVSWYKVRYENCIIRGEKGALNRSILVFYLALFELMFGAVNDFFSIKSRESFLLQKADLDFVLIYDKKRTS